MTNPIHRAIEQILANQEQRHAWLFVAGEQCRKWREEEGDLASPTVAGAPSGLSPSRSQAKPLIDYRKGGAE